MENALDDQVFYVFILNTIKSHPYRHPHSQTKHSIPKPYSHLRFPLIHSNEWIWNYHAFNEMKREHHSVVYEAEGSAILWKINTDIQIT